MSQFFCSNKCLNQESDNLIATCPNCFRVFEKPNGLPTSGTGKWVCGSKCKDKLDPPQQDLPGLDKAVKKKALIEEEIRHQQALRKKAEFVDLEFDYNYNDA